MNNYNVYLEVDEEYRFLPAFKTGRAILRVAGLKSKVEARKWALDIYPEAHYVDVHQVEGLGIEQPKYRPYLPHEFPTLMGRVIQSRSSTLMITSFYNVYCNGIRAEDLLKDYVFAPGDKDEGKPVGVLE